MSLRFGAGEPAQPTVTPIVRSVTTQLVMDLVDEVDGQLGDALVAAGAGETEEVDSLPQLAAAPTVPWSVPKPTM